MSVARFKITVGLDRDGTINQDIGYIGNPDNFRPIPRSLEAVAMLRAKGYNIVILTNQAGIMKGLMTPEDVEKVNARMLELLGQAGCSSIDGIYYSTTNLKEDTFAKPNVGMFKRAETELGVKFKVGHKKISQILKENNIVINKKGGQTQDGNSYNIESTKSKMYILRK
jgi:HAD superfamily hydrolase (TIGR01662 family)